MKQQPRAMRVFRVVGRNGRGYSKCIVREDVQRAKFEPVSYSFEGGRPWKSNATNHSDAWNALNWLRQATRTPEDSDIHPRGADSIDAALSKTDSESQELVRRARELMRTGSRQRGSAAVPKEQGTHIGEGSKRRIAPTHVDATSGAELQRVMQEVWDFGGGKRLRWKRMGRTPGGRSCEVLTFDGSDEVLVGPTGIELPAKQK